MANVRSQPIQTNIYTRDVSLNNGLIQMLPRARTHTHTQWMKYTESKWQVCDSQPQISAKLDAVRLTYCSTFPSVGSFVRSFFLSPSSYQDRECERKIENQNERVSI